MNLYSRGSEINGRTLDVVWSWRSWLVGAQVSRWQMFTGDDEKQRTVIVHLGPLHITTWRCR